MKTHFKILVIFILSIIMGFLMLSFIHNELNPFKWNKDIREMYCFLVFVSTGLGLIVSNIKTI